MNIDCYLSEGCGTEETLRKNLSCALAVEKVGAKVSFHRIGDAEAASLGLTGSPSIFINGSELQPQGMVGFS